MLNRPSRFTTFAWAGRADADLRAWQVEMAIEILHDVHAAQRRPKPRCSVRKAIEPRRTGERAHRCWCPRTTVRSFDLGHESAHMRTRYDHGHHHATIMATTSQNKTTSCPCTPVRMMLTRSSGSREHQVQRHRNEGSRGKTRIRSASRAEWQCARRQGHWQHAIPRATPYLASRRVARAKIQKRKQVARHGWAAWLRT